MNHRSTDYNVDALTTTPSRRSLNMIALEGVNQPDSEIELADIADKDIWISKCRGLTADLKDVALQKAVLAQVHNWS